MSLDSLLPLFSFGSAISQFGVFRDNSQYVENTTIYVTLGSERRSPKHGGTLLRTQRATPVLTQPASVRFRSSGPVRVRVSGFPRPVQLSCPHHHATDGREAKSCLGGHSSMLADTRSSTDRQAPGNHRRKFVSEFGFRAHGGRCCFSVRTPAQRNLTNLSCILISRSGKLPADSV